MMSGGCRLAAAVLALASGVSAQDRGTAKGLSAVAGSMVDSFDKQSKVALLVGVANYPEQSGLSQLHFPAEDVGALAAELRKQGYRVRSLVDADATRGVIRKALREISETIDPDQGTFLFYFSGHGFEQDSQNYLAVYGSVADDLKGEGLPLAEVFEMLQRSPARRKIAFIDACRNDPTTGRQVSGSRSFTALSQAEGLRVLYSSRPGGISFENKKLEHGVFTYFLLSGLRGEAAGNDGFITFQGLAQFVVSSVRSFSTETGQTQVPWDGGDATGDFLIARSPKVLSHQKERTPPSGLSSADADAEGKQGLLFAKAQQYSQSVEAFTKAIEARTELDQNAAEEYYFRGLSYVHLEKYESAIDDFSNALQSGGESAEVYEHRGYAYSSLNDFQHAIEDFNRALGLKPEDPVAYLNRGRAFLKNQQLEKAASDFDKFIELQPNAAIGYRSRAAVQLQRGEPGPAIKDLDHAIDLDPEKADAYLDRGDALLQSGQFNRALSDFEEAIRRQPNSGSAFEHRGRLYVDSGDYQKAVLDFTQAIHLDNSLSIAYANRAYAYAALKRYKDAIDDCNRAVDMDPYLPEAFNNRGYAEAGMRNFRAAVDDYDRAIKLKSDYAEAFENRSTAKRALGDANGAQADAEKAKSLKKRRMLRPTEGSRVAA